MYEVTPTGRYVRNKKATTMTQAANIHFVTSVNEREEYVYYHTKRPLVQDGLRLSFTTLLDASDDLCINIDALPVPQQSFMLSKFFHKPNILFVTDDVTSVVIPDDLRQSLSGTPPTQHEVAEASDAVLQQLIAVDNLPDFEPPSAPATANDKQIDGTHYNDMAIQPWDYMIANNFNPLQTLALRYLSRYPHKHKDATIDLRKLKHVVEKMIEVETAKQQAEYEASTTHEDYEKALGVGTLPEDSIPQQTVPIECTHYSAYSAEYEECVANSKANT